MNLKRVLVPVATPILLAIFLQVMQFILIGWLSLFLFPSPRLQNSTLFSAWNIWDAPHYLSLAQYGYQKIGDSANFIVFFPLFPILIAGIHALTQLNYLLSGYVVAFFFSLASAIVLYKLVLLDFTKQTALLSVLFLFLFPTSLFLHIPYTESLFLFLCVVSLYSARRGRFLLACVFGMFATATRLQGITLILPLIVEVLFYSKKKPKFLWMCLAIMIPLLGFLAYLGINKIVYGDYLYFVGVQHQHWFTALSLNLEGLKGAIGSIGWRKGSEMLMLGYAQVAAFFIGVVACLLSFAKLRLSYALFFLGGFLVNIAQSFWISQPRYLLTLFPLYIVVALLGKNIVFRYSWIFFSATFLVIFSLLAIQYGPVF